MLRQSQQIFEKSQTYTGMENSKIYYKILYVDCFDMIHNLYEKILNNLGILNEENI